MRPARVITFCSEMFEGAGVPGKMYNLSWEMLSREKMGMPRSLVRTSFCWFIYQYAFILRGYWGHTG